MMSDLMLLGILRMPESSIGADYASLIQFVSAARGAADRIEADAKIIEQLRAELEAARKEVESLETIVARCRDEAYVEGYAETLLPAAIGSPDDVPPFVSQTVIELRAELETAAADKQDALNQAASMAEVYLADHGIEQARECFPDAIRALAQRQEGS